MGTQSGVSDGREAGEREGGGVVLGTGWVQAPRPFAHLVGAGAGWRRELGGCECWVGARVGWGARARAGKEVNDRWARTTGVL